MSEAEIIHESTIFDKRRVCLFHERIKHDSILFHERIKHDLILSNENFIDNEKRK